MVLLWPAGVRQANLAPDLKSDGALVTMVASAEADIARSIPRAWPFVEAQAILQRLRGQAPRKGHVLFETGYGPSGLPHIGTFGEVVRTSMVRHAFSHLSDLPTRLFAFSDDMDALRKVPDNVPNKEMLAAHLGKPLTAIPDPFGTEESFGHHNNARLRSFLDHFGFDYEFMSASECYRAGRFDDALLTVLRHYDEVTNVVLPTLRDERRQSYSPFLPICPRTGRVLQAKVIKRDADAGTIVYEEEGRRVEVPVTGGHCKLQWKCDWAMRWFAFDVDYEMAGKDLIDSVALSSRICRILGGRPPENFIYELFLDENGEKISKSKGNGLAVEDWLRYAPSESLALFMYQKPRTAKRLYFGAIPRAVDEYLSHIEKFQSEDESQRLENPVWHIHAGQPPRVEADITFSVILNLVAVCHTEDPRVLWHFLSRSSKKSQLGRSALIDQLVNKAIAYYRDYIKPSQRYRRPNDAEKAALEDLAKELGSLPRDASAEDIQGVVYEVGKRHAAFRELRAWFRALYEILLGQHEGPRMGSFIAFYGIDETIELIRRALAGEDLALG